jgi:hypothetical protein
MENTPPTFDLFGKSQPAYVHDYPDKSATLERQHEPVGLGNRQRYNGLGNLTPAEPGVHYFTAAEFNSLTGLRGKKDQQLPSQYFLSADERSSGKQGLSAMSVADGEAFEDPQQSASAGQTAGLGMTRNQDVAEEAFELRLGTQILRNADAQSGLYASGLRRQMRLQDLGRQSTEAMENETADLYSGLKNQSSE